MNLKEIELDIGYGRNLVVQIGTDPNYPSIEIYLRTAATLDELVAYVECIGKTGQVRTIAFEGNEENPSSTTIYEPQYSIQN